MSTLRASLVVVVALFFLAGCVGATPPAGEEVVTAAVKAVSLTDPFSSPTGQFQTFSTTGTIDTTGPFFQPLGSNGRSCASCHVAQDGWTVTPADLQARFNATTPKGTDPIFRPIDGAVSPNADVSTETARASAYAMLLSKGLIRIGLPIPRGAEFALDAVDDPYGYASATELSMFRRPLPSTNLKFLSTVMWDGRETLPGVTITGDLDDQANTATLGHAQAQAALTSTVEQQIVAFEQTLFTAATVDNAAGDLTAKQGNGGPSSVNAVNFYLGINDVLGGDPNKIAFTPNVFDVYANWSGSAGKTNGTDGARGAVYRGMVLFNTKPITISGVKGLNDRTGVPASFTGSCSSCHDTPDAGNHSVPLPIDIGVAAATRRTPDLPLYTLRNLTTGEKIQTTDPGRALVTGRWVDIGKFKGPTLRALSSRAPYFHNGSAASLTDVLSFYDTRFGIGFTAQEKSDLVAFLGTL